MSVLGNPAAKFGTNTELVSSGVIKKVVNDSSHTKRKSMIILKKIKGSKIYDLNKKNSDSSINFTHTKIKQNSVIMKESKLDSLIEKKENEELNIKKKTENKDQLFNTEESPIDDNSSNVSSYKENTELDIVNIYMKKLANSAKLDKLKLNIFNNKIKNKSKFPTTIKSENDLKKIKGEYSKNNVYENSSNEDEDSHESYIYSDSSADSKENDSQS